MNEERKIKWSRLMALFLTGTTLQFWQPGSMPIQALAQPANPQEAASCTEITAPLTPDEQVYARAAWQYFVNNYQPATGFVNSTGGYPSGTLWDMANYLMALNAAVSLKIISQADFDTRLNKFLTTLSGLKLFEDALPNKVYNATNAAMTDYGNNPKPRGIGWSALDVGRMLSAFHIIRTCHPQYADWLKGIVGKWKLDRSVKDGLLYGTTVLPDDKTLLVQEGRLGYEEYAARGYELWGFKPDKAIAVEPLQFVKINNLNIPVDTRDYQKTNANNYVVSESYILDGIEFGLQGYLQDYAASVFEAQKRQYETTKELTAVSEDNIDKAPYFLYNTVFSNGVPWAVITDENKPSAELRTLSTKAAFGWRYLYPNDPYAQKVFDVAKDLRSPDGGGFYAGLYQETKQPNKALTGNTNGLILEILYFKARGGRPLISNSNLVTFAQAPPTGNNINLVTATSNLSRPNSTSASPPDVAPVVPVAPIPPVGNPLQAATCTEITAPLTPDEQVYARAAWQYFVNNYQPATGFVNSTGGYPSGTLWDMSNYLMALNAAVSLKITSQGDFDSRLNKLLTTLNGLKLFEDTLPNKVYNAATAEMTDYGNNPKPRGIGWSALDVGRMLSAFHIIRTCHPKYADWLKSIVDKWKLDRSVKDGELTGAAVLPDDKTLLVQEGRFGYKEYAARGYQLWGFKPDKAIAVQPLQFVKINNLNIPVDTRDYQKTNANNYVVSESYILDGIEFGLQGYLQDYAASVFTAQKRQYEATGELKAVSEDNIDKAPYFLYNTVYSNGVPWAVITDENKPYPELRTLSTKAAFGWRYLYPNDPYAQKVFDVAKDLRSPDGGGFYAGLYQETKQPNKILTGNTNGLILEILYFKARGGSPLIANSNLVTFAQAPPTGNNINLVTATPNLSSPNSTSASPLDVATAVAVAPIPPVGNPLQSEQLKLARPLKAQERRYAEAAWNYFKANYLENSGLVADRSDVKGVTLWGIGDYLSALIAARHLDIISPVEFDSRTRLLLGALTKLPLYANEVPGRGYDPRTLQPIDYGGNPVKEGTGWSALDIGRLMAALYNLKSSKPEYASAVDKILLDWSYKRVVVDRRLTSAIAQNEQNKQSQRNVVYPETRLGYEEYAARAFELWGFKVDRSTIGDNKYQTASVEGVEVPIKKIEPDVKPDDNKYTVFNPFLLYGLEFGIDPQLRQLIDPIRSAEELRYRRTGKLTAGGTTVIDRDPYVINSTVIAGTEAWATIADDGKTVPDDRMVSTATAFALHALYPENDYAQQVWRATTDLYSPSQGYYEGFYEKTGKPASAFSSSTNSTILQSLLYMVTNQKPLVRARANLKSPTFSVLGEYR